MRPAAAIRSTVHGKAVVFSWAQLPVAGCTQQVPRVSAVGVVVAFATAVVGVALARIVIAIASGV